MDIIADILIALSLLTVVATFFMGMLEFSKNTSKDASSFWMAWRVKAQAIAVVVLVLSAWWWASHGG